MQPTPSAIPEISILLTCYNFGAYLRQAVDSILSQETHRSFELIVVDDASPDRSFETLLDIDDTRLRLVVEDVNRGGPAAIMRGMSLVRGKYLCRWDGDDRWLPHALEDLATALDAHPNAVVAYGRVCLLTSDGDITETTLARPGGPKERDEFEHIFLEHYTCAPAMMGRMSAWQKALPWEANRIDWHYNLRLARLGTFVFVDRVLAMYRTHPNGEHVNALRSGAAEVFINSAIGEFGTYVSPAQLRRIVAHNYRNLALSRFGLGNMAGARQSFRICAANAPTLLFNRTCIGPVLACFVFGRRRYEALKSFFM